VSHKTIACSHCAGTGRVELPDVLASTLTAVDGCGKADWSATEMAYYLAIKPTAANNRLEFLRKLGFLSRTKYGKTWRYARKPHATSKGGG